MSQLILFNKPFNTLCQFTGEAGDSTLADYINVKNVYPAGRLDKDSEGLLLLTDDGQLQHQIADPKNKMEKTYWVQVEGAPDNEDLQPLREGVVIQKYKTKPAKVRVIDTPRVWERIPPIRERKTVPDSWLEIVISEGKNRQVRRMTASIGFPTLRLIRAKVGQWGLEGLGPGEFKALEIESPKANKINKRATSKRIKRFSKGRK
ncbi:pseudouridine synthase [Kangiella sediminilitoris]|uniref:Pseudouridine synthase n=1 Tax=Kangiella sediminilitoris TaxID=1144748 RepID=A0A1B3BAZ6_9GAMM|nr:pseudouridine synthase [Kangiella sediminilitoris]AOE49973.1 Pseudouridine synthase [Kangiella sediminilitoris]